jgi:lysophospholipase L1-like esterase
LLLHSVPLWGSRVSGFRYSDDMKRAPMIALVTALVVAGGVAYATHEYNDFRAACAPNEQNAEAAPTRSGTPGGQVVAVVGDSFTTGFGLEDPSKGIGGELGEASGWDVHLLGFGGSGYAAGSPCGGHEFSTRLGGIPTLSDVVIIQGGLNDVREEKLGELPGVVSATIREAERRAPAARIVLVGPTVVPYFDAAATREADSILATAATVEGVQFISTLVWAPTTVDGVHPDEQSAAAYARRIIAAVG